MTRSMTGFGRAAGEVDGEAVTVELSAVNHRFFDCTFRLPSSWASLEPALREQLKKSVSRGKFTASFRRAQGPQGKQSVQLDAAAAQQYIDASRQLAEQMSSTEALSLNTLAGMEGVFYQEEEEKDLERLAAMLGECLAAALDQLNAAREAEGEALAGDMRARVAEMADAVSVIEAELPGLGRAYEERLRARVAELAVDTALSEERLAIEVAVLAEKSDVNEEVVRLKTHFEHVLELLNKKEPIGRELNFIAQEIQRETNTLGSKLRDIGVTREILRIKSELEKLREQAQNIE